MDVPVNLIQMPELFQELRPVFGFDMRQMFLKQALDVTRGKDFLYGICRIGVALAIVFMLHRLIFRIGTFLVATDKTMNHTGLQTLRNPVLKGEKMSQT